MIEKANLVDGGLSKLDSSNYNGGVKRNKLKMRDARSYKNLFKSRAANEDIVLGNLDQPSSGHSKRKWKNQRNINTHSKIREIAASKDLTGAERTSTSSDERNDVIQIATSVEPGITERCRLLQLPENVTDDHQDLEEGEIPPDRSVSSDEQELEEGEIPPERSVPSDEQELEEGEIPMDSDGESVADKLVPDTNETISSCDGQNSVSEVKETSNVLILMKLLMPSEQQELEEGEIPPDRSVPSDEQELEQEEIPLDTIGESVADQLVPDTNETSETLEGLCGEVARDDGPEKISCSLHPIEETTDALVPENLVDCEIETNLSGGLTAVETSQSVVVEADIDIIKGNSTSSREVSKIPRQTPLEETFGHYSPMSNSPMQPSASILVGENETQPYNPLSRDALFPPPQNLPGQANDTRVFPDPLLAEMERIGRLKAEASKLKDNTILQLRLEYDKEMAEMVAQIRNKYELLRQNAETAYIDRQKELEAQGKTVLINKILATTLRIAHGSYVPINPANQLQQATAGTPMIGMPLTVSHGSAQFMPVSNQSSTRSIVPHPAPNTSFERLQDSSSRAPASVFLQVLNHSSTSPIAPCPAAITNYAGLQNSEVRAVAPHLRAPSMPRPPLAASNWQTQVYPENTTGNYRMHLTSHNQLRFHPYRC